jgi:hypothetical protein
LAGDAEAREEYVAGDLYAGSLMVINVPKLHTHSEPKFRSLLTERDARRVELARA